MLSQPQGRGGTAPLPPPLLPSFFFPFHFQLRHKIYLGEMHKMYCGRSALSRTFWIQGLPQEWPGLTQPGSLRLPGPGGSEELGAANCRVVGVAALRDSPGWTEAGDGRRGGSRNGETVRNRSHTWVCTHLSPHPERELLISSGSLPRRLPFPPGVSTFLTPVTTG